MTKIGKSDWEGTFARTRGNDDDAPIPDLRGVPEQTVGTSLAFEDARGGASARHLGQFTQARLLTTMKAAKTEEPDKLTVIE
jgi:hypothetical protein